MNSKKALTDVSERYYHDQIKILWERYHESDVLEISKDPMYSVLSKRAKQGYSNTRN